MYSTLFNTASSAAPQILHCVGGCWDRTPGLLRLLAGAVNTRLGLIHLYYCYSIALPTRSCTTPSRNVLQSKITIYFDIHGQPLKCRLFLSWIGVWVWTTTVPGLKHSPWLYPATFLLSIQHNTIAFRSLSSAVVL